MSAEEQMMQVPMQLPQGTVPYLQLGGKEVIELLETTTGKNIIEEEEQWYTKSRLLPLANLTERQQQFIIWVGMSEIPAMLRSANPFSPRQLTQIEEYMMMLVGQSSRAINGLERMRMSTTTFAMQQVPSQPQRKGGMLGFLTGNW